ncbi:aspartate/glutamate racemase family protein [Marinobacterium sp. CAU 1594]|nr:aspartate/glutamate racemase family protein [Marinobacterium arenosum]
MLETNFPRIPGDIGHAASWDFPVRYRMVSGASAERVVQQGAQGLLSAFIAAGNVLVAEGVAGIATSCGFLSIFQQRIAAELPVPVATSSLLQGPLIQALLPIGKRVGILTFSAQCLTGQHLAAAGIPADAPVVGLDDSLAFYPAIAEDRAELDVAQAERDMLAAANQLVRRYPEVGAILLECTNMAPYSAAIARTTGLPVYDVVNFIHWFHSGLRPRRFR